MNLPNSWVSFEIESLINEESSKLKESRLSVSRRFELCDNEIVKEDMGFVALPEILSAQYCKLSGNTHSLEISPPLQAFLSYAISIYDIVSDNHLYKDGKPTFLKTYGKESVLFAERLYKKIVDELSKELEKELPRAIEIASKMYNGTIKLDKKRNSRITSPSKAISLQNKLAGEHAYNIAFLSNAEELGMFSFHLVNAMTTLEDLIDLFHGEDFTGRKTTIPIAFLADEFGYVPEDIQTIKRSSAIKRTKEYISRQISSCRESSSYYTITSNCLLLKILIDIEDFNRKFLEEHL